MGATRWALAGVLLSASAIAGVGTEFNPVARHAQALSAVDAQAPSQRVIVRFRAAAALAAAGKPSSELVTALAGRARLTLRDSRQLLPGLHVMEFTPVTAGESLATSMTRLRADAGVQYVEVDQRRFAHAVPGDPLFAGQWYLQNAANTPSAVNALAAWDTISGSNGVVIADLDTGVRYDHPDLQRAAVGGRLLPGYDFVANSSIANDGDGRDADASDPGDWVNSADTATPRFTGCTVEGSSWHGTRTAGIIGALANNGTGISGINWSGFILPVRVLGKCGGFDSDIMAAMLWAAGVHVDGVPDNQFPARVENLSLGGSGTCGASYIDVLSQISARGVLVIASAGNEGGPVEVPANCPGVAAVAGVRHVGTKVGYSNLGPQVALSAPAGNCVNIGGGPCLFSIDTTTNLGATTPAADAYTDQLNSNVGTSFSAPIVTGIAGLMLAANGNLSAAQLLARLKEGTTRPFPVASDVSIPQCHVPASSADVQSAECSCTTTTCGAGLANAVAAVNAALRPIAAISVPASVSAGQNVVLQAAGSAAACRHALSSFAWEVIGGGANPPAIQGTQSSTATVVAPASGSFTLRLTVTDDAGRQDTADVVISAASAVSAAPASAGNTACLAAISASIPVVTVAPASASVTAGSGTQSFTAAVANTANTAVTWQVNGIPGGSALVGTITAAGVYSAPASVPTPATVTVSAVSVADSSRSSSAQVEVTAPQVVVVTPSAGSGGGGGGGSLDWLMLLTLTALGAFRARRESRGNRAAAHRA